MKKLSFFFISLLFGMVACTREMPDSGQIAATAAKEYYDLLLVGKYDEFMKGVNMPHKIPKTYYDQLILNTRMFIEQQNVEHKGIKSVDILNAKADTAHHVADVFLTLAYGDSTKEQIVVPMVEVAGTWKMR